MEIKNKYKFRVRIESFDNQQEVSDGSERVVRTQFTMVVHAYLLPETFDKKPVVKKSFSPKRIVFGVETDLRDCNGQIVISHDIPFGDQLKANDLFLLYKNHKLCF